MITLAKVTVFPIKALAGIDLETAALTKGGALKHDRRFALMDDKSKYVNGKRHPDVNRIIASFDLEQQIIKLASDVNSASQSFELREGNKHLETWFSDFFGFHVSLEENAENGFPDDNKRPGPTVISTASLLAVASWFPDLSIEEVRRRFRTNLELENCPAFWEDQLNVVADQGVEFRIGSVVFEGLKHSVRCPVPTQNTETGIATADFQKVFMSKRKETIPSWVNLDSFNHFYRLAINTKVRHVAGELQVGDQLSLLD